MSFRKKIILPAKFQTQIPSKNHHLKKREGEKTKNEPRDDHRYRKEVSK